MPVFASHPVNTRRAYNVYPVLTWAGRNRKMSSGEVRTRVNICPLFWRVQGGERPCVTVSSAKINLRSEDLLRWTHRFARRVKVLVGCIGGVRKIECEVFSLPRARTVVGFESILASRIDVLLRQQRCRVRVHLIRPAIFIQYAYMGSSGGVSTSRTLNLTQCVDAWAATGNFGH